MKILKFLSIFLVLSLADSFTVADELIYEPTLFATWNLAEVSGTIARTTQSSAYGVATWDFPPQSVVVTNSSTNENLIDKFKTGTYSYIMAHIPVDTFFYNQTISFSIAAINCIQFDITTLFITQDTADEITLTFIR